MQFVSVSAFAKQMKKTVYFLQFIKVSVSDQHSLSSSVSSQKRMEQTSDVIAKTSIALAYPEQSAVEADKHDSPLTNWLLPVSGLAVRHPTAPHQSCSGTSPSTTCEPFHASQPSSLLSVLCRHS